MQKLEQEALVEGFQVLDAEAIMFL